MCNRYKLEEDVTVLSKVFDFGNLLNDVPYGYVAPRPKSAASKAQPRRGAVVRVVDGKRRLDVLPWGFEPPIPGGDPVTNARDLAKPFWRRWMKEPAHRCLVPFSAFWEWSLTPDPATGRKREVLFEVEGGPHAFAGLWQPTRDFGDVFAFLTTTPNALVGGVHPKAMPVVLAPADYDTWLRGDFDAACSLARPCPAEKMGVALA